MKKIYRLTATFLSLFLLLSVTTYAYDPANSGISYSPTSDSMIYTNTQNFNQGAIVNAFNTLPENVRNLLRKEGVKIYYTEGIPSSSRYMNGINYDAITIGANYSYRDGNNKIISINRRVGIYTYADTTFNLSIPHECGHALDEISEYVTGVCTPSISETNAWINLYNANINSLKSIDYHALYTVPINASEAFAEAFRLYCTNPNGLKAACPEVYNFISAQIAKYAGGAPASSGVTKKNFDAKAYADTYPDLKAAFGYDKNALWNHYISYGKAEGRTVTSVQ